MRTNDSIDKTKEKISKKKVKAQVSMQKLGTNRSELLSRVVQKLKNTNPYLLNVDRGFNLFVKSVFWFLFCGI